jgi:hypothetical protein
MINYELALKLKEAGFPQREYLLISADEVEEIKEKRDVASAFKREEVGYHKTFDLSIYSYSRNKKDYYEQGKWRSSSIFSKEYLESEEGKKDTMYFPTLSELIEACGYNFGALIYRFQDQNVGWIYECIYGGIKTQGSTPEEAVANLWLELNESKRDTTTRKN